jgi:hypothetical protein
MALVIKNLIRQRIALTHGRTNSEGFTASHRYLSNNLSSGLKSSSSPSPLSQEDLALRRELISLYGRILRTHRTKLPFHLRELGDRYVKDEFNKHKKADKKWLVGFLDSWKNYASMLDQQNVASDSGIGRSLAPDEIKGLSDEQKNQLASLRWEAERAFKTEDETTTNDAPPPNVRNL